MPSLITSSKNDIQARQQFFNAGKALQQALAGEDRIQLGWFLAQAMSDANTNEVTSAGWFQVIQVLFPELDSKEKVLKEILSSTPAGASAYFGKRHLDKLVDWLKI